MHIIFTFTTPFDKICYHYFVTKHLHKEDTRMKNLSIKLSKVLYALAIFAASGAVNSVCTWRLYQEKMDEQLTSLNRYKDE